MKEHDSYIEIIVSKIFEGIKLNLKDIERHKDFKINVPGIPGKYYVDRISGSYEDSLHNLIHKVMWYEGIYDAIITDKKELRKIQNIINNYPNEIYSPDSFDAKSDEEIIILEQLSNLINHIHYKSIINVKNHLSKFKHFDASEFTFHGY